MLDQGQIFIPRHPARRIVAGLCSLLAHLAVLALVVLFYRYSGPTIVQVKSRATQVVSSRNYLAFNPAQPKTNRPSILPAPAHQRKRQLPKAEAAADSNGDSVTVIRQKAKKFTAGLMQNFKFRMTYGFIPNDEYSVAIQTSGAPPQIDASDLPPRYEQYLEVEITISIDGKVVDARLITGMVDQKIQDRVLAAVREYKYIPAKHNGSPIPSLVDLVIHVPS
ncbi:MAG TPA: hypothetical protein VFP71_03515 [Candidatus Angelobacter sp.]|nr:hypothetical protein [Candidatus Angelobacter sp.]